MGIRSIKKKKNAHNPIPFNRARILISGLNHIRLINRLENEKIALYDIERGQNELRITIKNKDCNKTFAILKKLCYNYKVESRHNISFLMKGILAKSGVIIGCIAGIIICFISSKYVWKINITGNQNICSSDILRVLNSEGIKVGGLKKSAKVKAQNVLNNFYGIKQNSVDFIGNTLCIKVYERDMPIKDSKGTNVASLYDARVTRIVITAGSPLVKKDDIVKIGTPLIDGIEYDSNGEKLRQVDGKGEVYGIVNFSSQRKLSQTRYSYVRTGKKKISTTFTIFGKTLGREKPPTYIYESEKDTKKFNFFIPIIVNRTYFYQVERIEEKLSLDKMVKIAKEEMIEEILTLHPTKNYLVKTVVLDEKDEKIIKTYITAEIKLN